jgi:hypothetical protein
MKLSNSGKAFCLLVASLLIAAGFIGIASIYVIISTTLVFIAGLYAVYHITNDPALKRVIRRLFFQDRPTGI